MSLAVYLAGPLGFFEAGRFYHREVIVPSVAAAGFEVLDPWAIEPEWDRVFGLPIGSQERLERLPSVNLAVGRRNSDLLQACDLVLAILDGPDVDSGTAAEIGYAAALKKPVVGLKTDLRATGDNEAAVVNLQVEWFVKESGGATAASLTEAVELLRGLAFH